LLLPSLTLARQRRPFLVLKGVRLDGMALLRLSFPLWGFLFALAYTQAPLYSSNQNTKFLIGLARAGMGSLQSDWLANTIDPLPVFTALVYLTHRFLNENLFYLYHGLLLAIYLYSMLRIASHLYQIDRSPLQYVVYISLLIGLHSYVLSDTSSRLVGENVREFLTYGVANQYVLGPIFQPSVFGVLTLLSIYLLLIRRAILAVCILALVCTLHSAYLPTAGLLTGAYVISAAMSEKNIRRSLLVLAWFVILCLPVLAYNYLYLGPTSADTWATAQHILANFVIRDHSLPGQWLGIPAAGKAVLIILALVLARASSLFLIILLPFAFGAAMTIFQLVLEVDSLGLLAPWRASATLVPLSTCVITGYLVSRLVPRSGHDLHSRLLVACSLLVCAVSLVGGVNRQMTVEPSVRRTDPNSLVMNYVREERRAGNNYLVPVRWMDFRLYTGAPAVVTFRSHPYKDVEVIEWYERMLFAQRFYELSDRQLCDVARDGAARYRVTHVVLTKGQLGTACDNLNEVKRWSDYAVYRVRAGA
jgi:hypothetical protein